LKNDRLKRKIQVSTLKRFLEPEGINI
jgi:hypothetical protein